MARLTRRAFMVAGIAVAGGVAFGTYDYRRTPRNPLTSADDAVVFNPWVVVRRDGVTVVTPRAEMGQGVHSALAALVAEEMDLDWRQVRAVHGPAAEAYFNARPAAMALPFAEFPHDWPNDAADIVGVIAGKRLKLQVTGGSSAIIDGYERMRKAGAAARAVLVQAAARRLGVQPETLRTDLGYVSAPDGQRLSYGELAEEAAALSPPADPTLKNPAEWRLLGRPIPRLDMADKVTGRAVFGIDIRPEGLRHAALRRTPYPGGTMLAFDAAAALATPGVERVVDLGDGVAVVARNTWVAMQALDAVRIEWSPSRGPDSDAEVDTALQAGFARRRNTRLRDDGDVDQALAGDGVLSAEYSVPFLAHATMEPMNATALYDGASLTLWTGSQAPLAVRRVCAAIAGLSTARVSVHTPFLGGGFGRRAETDFAACATRVAIAMPGTPVKLTWSREEDMTHDYYRPAARARMSGMPGADAPQAIDIAISAPGLLLEQSGRLTGLPLPFGPDRLLVEGAFDIPYRIDHLRVSGLRAKVDFPVGWWRSVGYSYNTFFVESFLDELCAASGSDPVAVRLRLLQDDPASQGVVEEVARLSGWTEPPAPGHARGIAFCRSFGTPTAEVVEVALDAGGIRLKKLWIVQDPGRVIDPVNAEAQAMSGALFGLSAAMMNAITLADGKVQEQNFPDYDALRIDRCPEVAVAFRESGRHLGGLGEPATPPAAPALANAIFALTGQRIRDLPLSRSVTFA